MGSGSLERDPHLPSAKLEWSSICRGSFQVDLLDHAEASDRSRPTHRRPVAVIYGSFGPVGWLVG